MSELDELMSKDPFELSSQDIDKIIEYQRKMQQQFASGIKPKKDKGPTQDISKVVEALKSQAPVQELGFARRKI